MTGEENVKKDGVDHTSDEGFQSFPSKKDGHLKFTIYKDVIYITSFQNFPDDFAYAYGNMLNEKKQFKIEKLENENNQTAPKTNAYYEWVKSKRSKYHKYNYKKRKKDRSREINTLARLNFDEKHCCFITLTFAPAKAKSKGGDAKNLDWSRMVFKEYIKRINRKYDDFLYIAVNGRSEAGYWHFHMLCNLLYEEAGDDLKKLWGWGSIRDSAIMGDLSFSNVIDYLINNLNDVSEVLEKKKGYLNSQHLKRRIILRSWNDDEHDLLEALWEKMKSAPSAEERFIYKGKQVIESENQLDSEIKNLVDWGWISKAEAESSKPCIMFHYIINDNLYPWGNYIYAKKREKNNKKKSGK